MTVATNIVPQPFPDLGLPLRCFVGMTEDVVELGETEVAHTVLGKTILLPSPWGLKYSIRLACSGEMIMPLPDEPFRKGSKVVYDSAVWRVLYVPADVGQVTLPREVAGVTVVDMDTGRNLTTQTSGRFVFFEPSPAGAYVRWRARHRCLVSVPPSMTTQVTGRDFSWNMELVEEYAS